MCDGLLALYIIAAYPRFVMGRPTPPHLPRHAGLKRKREGGRAKDRVAREMREMMMMMTTAAARGGAVLVAALLFFQSFPSATATAGFVHYVRSAADALVLGRAASEEGALVRAYWTGSFVLHQPIKVNCGGRMFRPLLFTFTLCGEGGQESPLFEFMFFFQIYETRSEVLQGAPRVLVFLYVSAFP